jgi:hypothetical protein
MPIPETTRRKLAALKQRRASQTEAHPDKQRPGDEAPPTPTAPTPDGVDLVHVQAGTDPDRQRPGDRATPTPAAPSLDPFDPTRLRMGQDFGAMVGVKRLLTTVPVRKPSKEVFVRTHPDPEYRLPTGVLELKEDREIYLVDPEVWPHLAAEATFSPRMLITTVTRQGVVFLWPVRLPGPDGRIDDWNRSALEAVETATKSWVRVQANMSLGAYDITVATGTTAAPEFPALSMGEILKIAFKDRYVTDLDHPVLRRLRGEV